MEINRRDFPAIMKDNDTIYISQLCGIIESVDELCHVQINYSPTSLHFRIAPSVYDYLEPILKEVLKLNNMFGIRLELSKSMKASSTITFDIITKPIRNDNRLQSREKIYLD